MLLRRKIISLNLKLNFKLKIVKIANMTYEVLYDLAWVSFYLFPLEDLLLYLQQII